MYLDANNKSLRIPGLDPFTKALSLWFSFMAPGWTIPSGYYLPAIFPITSSM